MSDQQELNLNVNVNLGIEPYEKGLLTSDADEKEIMSYLSEEVESVIRGEERERLVRKWATWRRISEARPEQDEKNYPWPKASNVTVPLTMTDTHGLYALMKASYGMKKPFFTVESTSGMHQHAKVVTKVLDALAESRNHMNLRKTNNTVFYDLVRLGTQFVKVPWLLDSYTFKRDGQTVTRTRRNSPAVVPIKIEDFLTRPYWHDVQTMPWLGIHIHKFKHELLQAVQNGIYDPDAVEKVIAASPTTWTEERRGELGRMGIDPSGDDENVRSIVEAYLFWDIDQDGIPEDIKVWFHPETQTVLRVEPNDLGIRDIVRIPYINLPGQLYAIGSGWICEPLQQEIDHLHNLRIDAEELHSMQMFATKTGSRIQGKIEMRPLKKFEFENPREDFQIIQFPGVGNENIQAEMLAREYANRATGASDYMMGFENKAIGTRSTFSGTQFLAAQGNRLFDAIGEGVDEAEAEIGQMALFQIVRNPDLARRSILPLLEQSEIPAFEDILEMNVETIPDVFSFRVTTTDSEKTEQLRMQQKMALFQLYNSYGDRVFQLAQLMGAQEAQIPPAMREYASRFFVGSTKLMEEIFKYFDTKQTDDYLPFVEDIDMMLDAQRAMKEGAVAYVRESGRQNGGGSTLRGGNTGGAGPQPNVEGTQGGGLGPGNGNPPGESPFGG